jgi:hypothetical protein
MVLNKAGLTTIELEGTCRPASASAQVIDDQGA